MQMPPRVLIISPQVFEVPHSGVGMRGHFQAMHLSRLWPVTVATEAGVYDVIDGVFTERYSAPASEVPGNRAYMRSLLSRKHYLYEKYNGRRWSVPDLDSFTHVIVHYPALLEFIIGKAHPRTKILFDTHNNEREYFESVAAKARNPAKRLVIRKQALVSERIIAKAAGDISVTISVSESDRDWIAELCDPGTVHFVVPNNLFQYKPTRWTGRKSILYVGSLNVTMNLQALDWFTTMVWPRIKQSIPDVDFVVAGRNPSESLIEDLRRQGIKVVANAPSLTDLYADCMYSLIPASSGSGGKIKVCEALAHGVPVLTTTHGLVGQPAAIKECCNVRDHPDGWIQAIEDQLMKSERSTIAWDSRVRSALNETYFGSSILEVAEFIAAD